MPPKNKTLPAKEKNCSVGDGLRDASSQTPVDSHDINEILVFIFCLFKYFFKYGNLTFFINIHKEELINLAIFVMALFLYRQW